jgi:23S rRNA pseudouridine2457 synthase
MLLLLEQKIFMARLVAFNKPYGVICQFSGEVNTLAKYVKISGIYPIGRLDKDSEGLVILTDDGKLQNKISHPKYKKSKTYIVQVEGLIDNNALIALNNGVQLKDGITKPANAELIEEPSWLWSRSPPIRSRKNIPTSWIEISITEGKNRQVRRMTAVVGFPTLRLIRTSIDKWNLNDLPSGSYVTL